MHSAPIGYRVTVVTIMALVPVAPGSTRTLLVSGSVNICQCHCFVYQVAPVQHHSQSVVSHVPHLACNTLDAILVFATVRSQ